MTETEELMVRARFTEKQQLFIKEFLVDLNATQAAIRAGYSKKTANRIASENLSKPDIQEAIATAMQARNERVEIGADYVLQRLLEIDRMSIADILQDDGTLKPISAWPMIWQRSVGSIDLSEIWEGSGDGRQLIGFLKKIKWPDKLKALELIGRHTRVGAFKDRQEIDVNVPTVVIHDPERVTYQEDEDDV